jgi:predicted HD phosphohydrolase
LFYRTAQPGGERRSRPVSCKLAFVPEHPIATFSTIENSTAEDWALIAADFMKYAKQLPTRIIAHLKLLDGDFGGFPVDRLHHSLLTATLAMKDKRDDEYIACALLHDIGDTLGSFNHPDIAAAILKPFVSEENHWMVEKHGIFQGYYFFHHIGMDRNMREHFRGHPHFLRTAEFCEKYDGPAFDAKAECFPLEAFESVLSPVFEKPKNTIYRVKE